jgi:hypothetical protein
MPRSEVLAKSSLPEAVSLGSELLILSEQVIVPVMATGASGVRLDT